MTEASKEQKALLDQALREVLEATKQLTLAAQTARTTSLASKYDDQVIHFEEVVELLGVSKSTVLKLVKGEQLKAGRLGHKVVFSKKEINRFLGLVFTDGKE